MPWLEGLLTGYNDAVGQIRKQNAAEADARADRESKIFTSLLQADDPHIRALAATGLVTGAAGPQTKRGIQGWMGDTEKNPVFPQMLQYMQTPQPKTTTTETTIPGYPATGLPSTQFQGATALPHADTGGSLAQWTGSPTEGGEMAAPQPLAPPRFEPDMTMGAQDQGAPPPPQWFTPGVTGLRPLPPPEGPPAPLDFNNPDTYRLPAPRAGDLRAANLPPGVAAALTGATGAGAPAATTAAPPAAGAPGATAVPTPAGVATPPPTPPQGAIPANIPGMTETQAAAPTRVNKQLTTTTTQELPEIFVSPEERAIRTARAGIEGKYQAWRYVGQLKGEPDPDKYAANELAAELTRAGGGALPFRPVTFEYPGPDGKPIRASGFVDDAHAKYYMQDGITPVPPGSHIVSTTGSTRAVTPPEQAARSMGYESAADAASAEPERFATTVNSLLKGQAAAKAGGTDQGRYDEDKARIKPWEITYAADGLQADVGLQNVFLAGHTPAFKDAVLDELATRGVTLEKLSEATRSMAQMAKDVLPRMDAIRNDAIALDKLNMIGPIAGRWNDFVEGTVGSSELGAMKNVPPEQRVAAEALFSQFRTEVHLLQQAVQRAHAGIRGAGSQPAIEKLDNVMSAKRMDLTDFLGSLNGIRPFMVQYSSHLPDWGKRGPQPSVPETGGAGAGSTATGLDSDGRPTDPVELQHMNDPMYTHAPSGRVWSRGTLVSRQ